MNSVCVLQRVCRMFGSSVCALAAIITLNACAPLEPRAASVPPSLDIVPPNYYRTYMLPERRTSGGDRLRTIILERPASMQSTPRNTLSVFELDAINAALASLEADIQAARDKATKER